MTQSVEPKTPWSCVAVTETTIKRVEKSYPNTGSEKEWCADDFRTARAWFSEVVADWPLHFKVWIEASYWRQTPLVDVAKDHGVEIKFRRPKSENDRDWCVIAATSDAMYVFHVEGD